MVFPTGTPANASRPEEQDYYYDSEDSVVDLDTKYPDISEWVVEWKVARLAAAPLPSWHPSGFSRAECICFEREPDLRQVLNEARQNRMVANIPIQPVAPLVPLPQEVPAFGWVRDLDQQHQWCYHQTIANQQTSPLEDDQCKRAKTPPQPDLEDAPSWECSQTSRTKADTRTVKGLFTLV